MQLRLAKLSILLATLLPLGACSPSDQVNPDADELPPVAELGSELRTDMTDLTEKPDMTGKPSCMLVGGCPVDLPVTKPVVYRFWGSSVTDVWAVGKGGLTMNWNGTTWRRFGNPATGDLWAVWGSAANDVWAVGNDATIVHWNGSVWAKTAGLTTPSGFNDVWGTSATDAWAVGDSGAVLHWDGTKWSQLSIPYVNGFMTVWGAATNDVWVGGEAGMVLRWDGTKMNEVASGGPDTILRIRGSSVSTVYMTTDKDPYLGNYVQKWDGTKWAPVGGNGQELWVIDDSKVWVLSSYPPSIVGPPSPPSISSNYWNGLIWTNKRVGSGALGTALWATDKDGWSCSANGQMYRFNGTDWVVRW